MKFTFSTTPRIALHPSGNGRTVDVGETVTVFSVQGRAAQGKCVAVVRLSDGKRAWPICLWDGDDYVDSPSEAEVIARLEELLPAV